LIEPAVLRWRKGKLGQATIIELTLNSLAKCPRAVR
jgi:hypothetical protein